MTAIHEKISTNLNPSPLKGNPYWGIWDCCYRNAQQWRKSGL